MKREFFVQDEVEYVKETYDNGVEVIYVKTIFPEQSEPSEPLPPEPTQEELNTMALMEGIASLYETQIALEDRMTTDNITVIEGIAGLFEAQMGGV